MHRLDVGTQWQLSIPVKTLWKSQVYSTENADILRERMAWAGEMAETNVIVLSGEVAASHVPSSGVANFLGPNLASEA
eukprot:6487659-Amphidinium_carterae.1